MKYARRLFILLVLVLPDSRVSAYGNLSAHELRALISGNTAEGEQRAGVKPGIGPPTMVENYPEDLVAYFAVSGTVKCTIGNTHDSGAWRITRRGKLCIAWRGEKEKCAPVHKEGNVYKRITRSRFGRILREQRLFRFLPGNAHGL
ncbi:MAG: hypothetical protein PVI50_01265 [Gammaproteobacteria bacterium]|jgi:hypothetical protein